MGTIKEYFWSVKTEDSECRLERSKKMEILWLLLPPSHSCGLLGKYHFPYGGLSYSRHVWERIGGRRGKHLSPQSEQALQVSGNSVISCCLAHASVDFFPSPHEKVFLKREVEGILMKPSESFKHACWPSISACTDLSTGLFLIALFVL